MEWKTDQDYIRLCYPKRNQPLYIHSEDVVAMLGILKKYKPKVILEIGSAYGTSTKLFAAVAEEFGGHKRRWNGLRNECKSCRLKW